MNELAMDIRSVDVVERVMVGVVAPYDEVSYLVPDPGGERISRGAFKKSISERASQIPLYRNHDHSTQLGRSKSFEDTDTGLVGVFTINEGPKGDDFLEDLRNGYLGGLSVGFMTLGQPSRGDDGVREVREAKLLEVSAVGMPAYESAALMAVRNARPVVEDLMTPFRNRPDVNLEPIPRPWG